MSTGVAWCMSFRFASIWSAPMVGALGVSFSPSLSSTIALMRSLVQEAACCAANVSTAWYRGVSPIELSPAEGAEEPVAGCSDVGAR